MKRIVFGLSLLLLAGASRAQELVTITGTVTKPTASGGVSLDPCSQCQVHVLYAGSNDLEDESLVVTDTPRIFRVGSDGAWTTAPYKLIQGESYRFKFFDPACPECGFFLDMTKTTATCAAPCSAVFSTLTTVNVAAGADLSSVDHGTLRGLSDDDHPQYALDSDLDDLSVAWADITGEPATFPPDPHTIASHSDTNVTGAQLTELAGGGETALHSHAGGSGLWTESASQNVAKAGNDVRVGGTAGDPGVLLDRAGWVDVEQGFKIDGTALAVANLSDGASVSLLGASISPAEMTGLNAGTALTDDLEEEAHGSEHAEGGADALNLGSFELDDIGDVDAAAPGSGQVLTWTGSAWGPEDASGGSSTLGGLTDVTESGSTAGRIIIDDGLGEWRARSVSGDATLDELGALQLASGVVGATEIASGAVADVDVAEGADIAVDKLEPGTAGQFLLSNATPTPTWTSLSGDGTLSSAGALDLAAAAVDDAELRDSAARSVIGRSAATSGAPADIVAGTDGHVLKRASGTVGFGALVASEIPAIDHGSGLSGLTDDDHARYLNTLADDTYSPGISGLWEIESDVNSGAVVLSGHTWTTVGTQSGGGIVVAGPAYSVAGIDGGDIYIRTGATTTSGLTLIGQNSTGSGAIILETRTGTGAGTSQGALALSGTSAALDANLSLSDGRTLSYEGATDDEFETTISAVDPTADNAILLPDASGTLAVSAASPLALDADTGEITCATCGTGDVDGPASSVDNAIARFDGTTGKILQDYTSGAPTVGDTGAMSLSAQLSIVDTTWRVTEGVDAMTFSVPALTAARAVTFPDAAGQVSLLGQTIDLASAEITGVAADANVADDITIAAGASVSVEVGEVTGEHAGTDLTADLEEEAHAGEHEIGGADELDVTDLAGELADAQKVAIHKGGAAATGTRAGINFIEGSNVTITLTDDAGDGRVDVEIASAAAGTSELVFKTINAPAGTDPVADAADDTLNLTSSGATVTITGTSGTDTINLDVDESALDLEDIGGSLAAGQIDADAITAAEIAAGAVGTSEVAADSLTAGDLAANSVEASEIATGAVTTAEILDGTILAGDLAADAVTATAIIADAVGSSEVAAGAIGASELAAGAVDLAGVDITGLLPLANLTDGGTATHALFAGGGGGDPSYRAIAGADLPAVAVRTDTTETIASVHTFSAAPVFSAGFSTGSVAVVTGLNADQLDTLDSTDFALASHAHSGADITSGTVAEARIHADIHRDSESKDGDLVTFDDPDSNFAATDVDSAIAELDDVNGSGVNAADGKVEWSQLVGVPADFADETDDIGTPPTTTLDDAYANGTNGTNHVVTLDEGNILFDLSETTNDYRLILDNTAAAAVDIAFQIAVTGAGASFTTAIDVSDSDIGTALALGANDVTVNGATLSAAEIDDLDSGINFSEIVAGTSTAALVVGTGGSLAVSGSGTIAATDLACTGCVGATDLATDSVEAAEIAASAVGTSEVADNTLTADDLAADSVAASEIAANAVGTSEIATDAVEAAEIATGAVTTTEILNNTIANSDVANDAFSFSEFNDTMSLDANTHILTGDSAGLDLEIVTSSAEDEGTQALFDADTDRVIITQNAVSTALSANVGLVQIDAAAALGLTGQSLIELTVGGSDDTTHYAIEAADAGFTFVMNIGSEPFCDNCLDAGDLADSSVAAAEIATGAVGDPEIEDGAVEGIVAAKRFMASLVDQGAATISSVGHTGQTINTPASGSASNADGANGAAIQFQTGATGTSWGGITADIPVRRDWAPDSTWYVSTGSAITDIRLWAGSFSGDPHASATPAGDYAGFRYDTATDGTAFWRACTDDGGAAPTCTTTTAAVTTSTAYTMRIVQGASDVKFYVDGALVATNSANLPAATTVQTGHVTVMELAAANKRFIFGHANARCD